MMNLNALEKSAFQLGRAMAQRRDLTVIEIAKQIVDSHGDALTENEKLKRTLKYICLDIIPALKDWMQTTGYGEIHRRDKVIVESAERILKDLEKE